MNRLKFTWRFLVALFLFKGSVLFGMLERSDNDVVSHVENNVGLIADYWFAIEDVGLPLDAKAFEGNFTIEQMIDFLGVIKKWQSSCLRYQTMKRLIRIFEKKYSGLLFVEDKENVYCVVCGRKYKRYAPCVRHILNKHFCFDQVFKFAER